MEDIINDEILGSLRYNGRVWGRRLDTPVLNSDGNLIIVFQDDNKEGILDVQREAYKTYLQNEEKLKNSVTDYLLDHYKWINEYFMRTVSGIDESFHKDVVTEKQLYQAIDLWYLFICRDGSFGYAFGCCWDRENDLAILLSESEPRVITLPQLENLHKLNDPTVGLLVHDGKNAWKSLEVNKFFGKPENLEIELEGGVEEGITPAQQKAYADYLERKDQIFKDFSKMMLTIYMGSEKQAENTLLLGHPIAVKSILPKTLYIDRKGNYGWSCYTDWDKRYVDVLLSLDTPYIMEDGSLQMFSIKNPIVDKEMGVFFDDYLGLSSTIIVRIGSNIYTLPFTIEFFDDDKVISEDMRNSYKQYIELSKTLWEDVTGWSLDYCLSNYDELEKIYDLPESLQRINLDENSVMSLMKITKLYMSYNGRIAWLCEFPTAADGLAYEFTKGYVCMITQPEII